jgi:acetyl-CoA carboxylase carboxyltransferase component
MYERGKALSIASVYEIDDVIDPADSRRWISTLLRAAPPADPANNRRTFIDTW